MIKNNFIYEDCEKKSLLWHVLSYVIGCFVGLLGIALVLYNILGPAEWYMTSDCTDSLLWGQATLESGKLVSPDFHYAAVIPFGGNLIFLPWLAIFGYSMAAQIGGLCTYAILLFAAVIYLARGLGYKPYVAGGMLTVLLLILSSSAKLREIMWEHIFYYNLGILFFCLGLGLAVRIFKNGGFINGEKKKLTEFIVLSSVLSVFTLLCATNGLQSLVCFILPVLGAMFAVCFLDGETKLLSRRNLFALIPIGAMAIATLIGLKLVDTVTGGVTAGYQEAYSTYSAMETWSNNFLNLFKNWFSLLGVSVAQADPLMSEESIFNIIRIFGALLLLVAPIVMLCGYKNIQSHAVKMLLIGHFAVSAFIIFASVFGNLGGANWRLTPMVGTAVLATFAYGADLIARRGVAARVGALILAFLLLTAALPALEIKDMKEGEIDKYDAHLITEALEEHGLKTGYATFWRSQIITMLSDSEIQCRVISDDVSVPTKRNYQSSDSWYEDVPGEDKYFLLLTMNEYFTCSSWIMQNEDIQIDDFSIKNEETGAVYFVYVYSENFISK